VSFKLKNLELITDNLKLFFLQGGQNASGSQCGNSQFYTFDFHFPGLLPSDYPAAAEAAERAPGYGQQFEKK
jgi:hypothetical protein